MLHPFVIALVIVLLVHDVSGRDLVATPRFGAVATTAISVAPMIAIAIFTHALLALRARALRRTGKARQVIHAERAMVVTRGMVIGWHAWCVLGLGWLESVRASVGDLIVIDEAIVTLPPLLVLIAGWWSFYPLERMLRDASVLRSLDQGIAVHAPTGRGGFVLDKIRHAILPPLAPLTIILAWVETVAALAPRLDARGWWPADPEIAELLTLGLHALGVVATLLVTPPLLRVLWSTVELGPGELRDRLADLCRVHGVRCRAMLVWRTHGMMINGAVMGLIAPLRYILLTDALLERLPQQQVEAVMAHEVGHVRRKHLIWLMMSMVAAAGLAGFATQSALQLAFDALNIRAEGAVNGVAEAGVLIVSLTAGLLALGYVSRRFERQADAFAVQHLSGLTRDNRGRGIPASDDAVNAMRDALVSVADLNHIPRNRFTWRHGSIAQRLSALDTLRGAALDRFPIDRRVRLVKLTAALAFLAMLGAAWIDAQRMMATM